jgi:hypothetical protein
LAFWRDLWHNPPQAKAMTHSEHKFLTFNSIWDSEKIPDGWRLLTTRKVKIKNRLLLAELRKVKPGKWQKIYSVGADGTEIHYFQHQSGIVFNVKVKHIVR